MSNKIEFETFRQISNYEISNLTFKKPSVINYLSYRKYKVTIEPIEEPVEVYIERLNDLLDNSKSYTEKSRIKDELIKLTKQI